MVSKGVVYFAAGFASYLALASGDPVLIVTALVLIGVVLADLYL